MREHLKLKYIDVFLAEENPYYLEEDFNWRDGIKRDSVKEGEVSKKPMSYKMTRMNSEARSNLFEPILRDLREYLNN